jgi:hypothetical protein
MDCNTVCIVDPQMLSIGHIHTRLPIYGPQSGVPHDCTSNGLDQSHALILSYVLNDPHITLLGTHIEVMADVSSYRSGRSPKLHKAP